MSDKSIEFFPFNALNEFMRDDFRLSVVQSTLSGLASMDEKYKAEIDKHVKKGIQIPGFRRPEKAPNVIKAAPIARSFEKDAGMVVAVLVPWAELNSCLRQRVFDMLKTRQWELLPVEADRSLLPGFLVKWPKSEDFETLYKFYQETYPQEDDSLDKVCLMVVWITMRLPYEVVEEDVASLTHVIYTEEAKKQIEELEHKEDE